MIEDGSHSPARRSVARRQKISRRGFLQAGLASLGGCAAAGLLGGLYAYRVEPDWVEYTRAITLVTALPQALDGLTIAQISDIHATSEGDIERLREVVGHVNDLALDIVALTGDFITGSAEMIGAVAEALVGLQAPHGLFAVLGNHDVWIDPKLITDELRQAGIVVLRDEAAAINREEATLWVLGLDDPGLTAFSGETIEDYVPVWWERREALEGLLNGLPSEDPRVVLVHNPDLNEVFGGLDLDLALSGHTHGGQVRLPLLGAAFVPSCMGDKYVAGFAAGPSSPVYVNRGLGTTGMPVRLNCRPEVTLIEIHALEGWTGK